MLNINITKSGRYCQTKATLLPIQNFYDDTVYNKYLIEYMYMYVTIAIIR